jgi:hypothetical protein
MFGFVTFIGILGLLPFGVQWVAVGCIRDDGLDELVGNVKVDGKALGQRLDGPPCKKVLFSCDGDVGQQLPAV